MMPRGSLSAARAAAARAAASRAAAGCAALLLALAGCGEATDRPAAAAGLSCQPAPGDFSRRWLLTGEVATREAAMVTVPEAPVWPLKVRYLIEDGHRVEAGEKIAEFDAAQLLSGLDGLETRVQTAANELEASASRAAAELADLELERVQKLAARDRAAVEARLPAELVPAREVAEKKLALERAELELANAEAKLKLSRETQRNLVALSRLELEQAQAELSELRTSLQKMVVTAPIGGVFFASDHPREPRQVKAGDDLFSGFNLGRIPSAAGWQIEARLLDVDDGKVAAGQEALVFLDGDPAAGGSANGDANGSAAGGLHGRIRRIDQVAQEISRDSPRRAFTVIVDVDELAAGHGSGLAARLRPGMSARIEVIESPRRVALLPRRCLDGFPAERVLACGPQVCEVAAAAAPAAAPPAGAGP